MVKTVFIVLDVLLLIYILIVLRIYTLTTNRQPDDKKKTFPDKNIPGDKEPFMTVIKAGRNWYNEQEKQTVRMKSYDDLIIKAHFIPAQDSRGAIILAHGYMSDGITDFACLYRYLHDLGYDLLNIFQRGCGLSAGQTYMLGAGERIDTLAWATYLANGPAKGKDIFIFGMGMGAAAALMASSLGLPENVRGIIAEAPFTSAWEEMRHELKGKLGFLTTPTLFIVDGLCRWRGKFSLRDGNASDSVKRSRLPVLIFHGGADKVTPVSMSEDIYSAASGEKEMFTVPNAGHLTSFMTEEAACREKLEKFLNKYASTPAGTVQQASGADADDEEGEKAEPQ
ncbi:MAG: alpha/beta hydrolase [Eubacteriaceae bacterium]|nr:alpha/beta hydrolase [Eubacteriaceae bacterium]